MKTILILAFTDIKNDPRVYKQILFLKDDYNIVIVGTKSPEVEGVKFIKFTFFPEGIRSKLRSAVLLKLNLFEQRYWTVNKKRLLEELQTVNFDLILANDLITLPLAVKLKNNKPLVFDAHEYYPDELNQNWIWKFFLKKYHMYQSREYIPKTDKMITVCDGIKQVYEQVFNIKIEDILMNLPFNFPNLRPSLIKSDKKIRLVHHGAAIPSRNLEKMIEMFKYLKNRFEMHFHLVDYNNNYTNKLKKLSLPYHNVFIHKAPPMTKIIDTIKQYDIGIFSFNAMNTNHLYTLPNKLFEFIQARLAVVVGPSPEMVKIVNKYEIGKVTDDFSAKSLADSLNSLTIDQINQYKQNSHNAAFELSAETNKIKLQKIVSSLI